VPGPGNDMPAQWAPQSIPYQPMTGNPRQSDAVAALFLSILGFFCCGIPSVIGMVMGRMDINAIESGQTDPRNHNIAQAAFIVGLIATLLTLGVFLFYMLLVVAAVVGSGGA
jgi:hypothetical protein